MILSCFPFLKTFKIRNRKLEEATLAGKTSFEQEETPSRTRLVCSGGGRLCCSEVKILLFTSMSETNRHRHGDEATDTQRSYKHKRLWTNAVERWSDATN